MFHTVFRGAHVLLSACLDLTVHTTAVERRLYQKYTGYGDWDH